MRVVVKPQSLNLQRTETSLNICLSTSSALCGSISNLELSLKAMLRFSISIVVALISLWSASAAELPVYIGTYTGGESQGIYLLSFNTDSGELAMKGVAAETTNPSFLAVHEDGKHLYAVNETGTGELSAFKIDEASGMLTFINEVPSGGGAPCHLVIDETGRNLLVANYSGGSVSVTKIARNGSLGKQASFVQHVGSSVNKQRQKEPHAHSINLDASNSFAVVADLGTDELLTYTFNARSGKLRPASTIKLAAGSGPRHFAFHPDGKHAYAINELLSTVSVLEYNAEVGSLSQIQTITTLPRDFTGNSSTAEVRVSANGKFVYGSNRGHDSIAVFRVNPDHRLTLVQIEKIGGKTPRNFTLDPTGRFLLAAGQSTNDIHVFEIDPALGKLSKTEHTIKVPSPVCIRFAK